MKDNFFCIADKRLALLHRSTFNAPNLDYSRMGGNDQGTECSGAGLVEIFNERNRQFYDYWKQLPRAEGSLLPYRSSFLPEEIPDLLPNLLLFEVISKDFMKIRLQGTTIDEQYGSDMAGANYLDFVEPKRREVAASAFVMMAETPCGIVARLDQLLTTGRYVTVEAIGFPLLNDRGDNPIIIYSSNELRRSNRFTFEDEYQLHYIYVLDREIIDIGAGAPEFHDLPDDDH